MQNAEVKNKGNCNGICTELMFVYFIRELEFVNSIL